VGETLQFQLRDADTADDDLRALLTGRAADAALVFTSTGRGLGLFDVADHDAGVVDEYLGRLPAAGMFCAGELGPVGGRNFVHGATASIALLREAGRFGS
jgi:small ligand-binding sensory domain FIST